MKKINDSKLYLYFSIITLVIGIVLACIFSYSAFIVEPDIRQLLQSENNIDENYKKAYLKLRSPQIFARYQNFDSSASGIKTILDVYDRKIEGKEAFDKNDKPYLQKLLDRREQGALLTRNTMIFSFLLTVLGIGFYLFERKENKDS